MSTEAINPLRADIQAQPENLRRVIDHLSGPHFENLRRAASFLQDGKPIVFIGMTSAAYLCHPAEHYLASHGRLAAVMQASDALYSMLPALSQAHVVINSRSGRTVEIVKLASTLNESGIPFLAVTNEPESPLAKLADQVLWTSSRPDDLVSINIITAMMTATLVLAAEALGKGETIRASLQQLPELMDRAVETAWDQADALLDLFLGVNPIYLLHRGVSKGAAHCARLVIEEVARRPAVAMEAGEFRQGPIEVVDQDFGAIVYVLEGEAGLLNCRLAEDIRLSGGRVYLVGKGVLCEKDGPLVFQIPCGETIFQPVLEVVPSQILAYKLAEAQGLKPGQVRYITKVITTEIGLPGEATSTS